MACSRIGRAGRRGFAWRLAWLLALLLWPTAQAFAGESFPDGVTPLFTACYYPDYEGAAAPGPNERCVKRELPAGFRIRGETPSFGDRWFRVEFDVEAHQAGKLYGVYLPSIAQNVAVYLDGSIAGSSTHSDRLDTLNTNIPQLFVLPENLLTPGRHDLHVRIYSGFRGTGRLAPFAIGPLHLLAPEHRRRAWLQFHGPQAINLGVALIGVTSIVLWFRRRNETAFGYFALVCALWIVRNLHLSTVEPWLHPAHFDVVAHGSVLWLTASLHVFCFRMLGKRFRRLEAALWAYALCCTLALFATDRDNFWAVARYVLILPQISALLLAGYLARQAWVRRETATTLLFAATVATVLLGTYDSLLWQNKLPFPRIFLMPYGSLLFAAVAGWALVDRVVRAQMQFERLNRELEHRVREKEADLARNYARLADLERERTIAVERQRILRDIHDGLGSQLLTSISLVERGQMQSGEVALLLRECVDDLRIAIDSLRPTGSDLLAVLGNLRYRLEPRLAAAGISLTWDVRDTPPLPPLDSEGVLNVMRMAQEALTNIVKHAHASHVVITFHFDREAGRHCLTISDNGQGFDLQSVQHGDGLRNMTARGQRSRAQVRMASSPGGTCVTIHLPPSA